LLPAFGRHGGSALRARTHTRQSTAERDADPPAVIIGGDLMHALEVTVQPLETLAADQAHDGISRPVIVHFAHGLKRSIEHAVFHHEANSLRQGDIHCMSIANWLLKRAREARAHARRATLISGRWKGMLNRAR
jgi:hypothetical protein